MNYIFKMEILFESDKTFRVWDFHISHSRFLLRNTEIINENEWENTDIIFGAVNYLEVIDFFEGITIVETSEDDLNYLKNRVQKKFGIYTNSFCTLKSNNQKYFVGASSFVVCKNNLLAHETFESGKDFGQVIFQHKI